MKKLFWALSLVLGVILILPSKTFAQDYSYTDYVNTFNSDVKLNQDASISIKETIDYHFTFTRHGIYREIPINYKTNASFTRPTLLKLNDLYYFRTGFSDNRYNTYEREYGNGYATFKIGDGDTSITGDYTYVLDYKLTYANNYFDDYDELYINITGTGWDVPINSVIANITVPGKITNKLCYTGTTDSTVSNCTFTELSENKVTVNADSLGVYEGLTVVIAMPKGTITDTTNQQRIQSIIANLGIFLPILAIVVVIIASTKVNKNKKITVIPNYDVPKGWNPLRSGFVYKNGLPSNIITAQIINFAIYKYIKIKQVSNKEYELIKTDKEAPTDVEERILYDGLFDNKDTVSLKSLSTKFYATVATLKASTEKRLYSEEYYSNSQKSISNKFGFLGILGIILCFFSVMLFVNNAAMSWFWGLLISFTITAIFGFSIDKRSTTGNEMYYELEGLKMYINTAEKHRIEFHDNPKKYLGVFEKLLPYAMIFGLEKKWAKEFEDMYVEPPSWYVGSNNSLFNAYLLTSALGHMNHQVVAHATPSNSANGFASSHGGSGGSGFSGGSSGGGFGGGGGGSW